MDPSYMRTRPIAIDLFAGVGGLSLGLEQAGFDVLAAVELDPVHACAHAFNFPHCQVIPQSVSDLTGHKIRAAAQLAPTTLIDLVAGGAPCQGFSLMGQRALDDPRNALIKDFIRLVRELQPAYFLFENVRGLTVGPHRQFLREIIQDLGEAGYRVLHPWQVLNAKDYGVPQSRERLFLLGAQIGRPLPRYPDPLGFTITCAEALDDLPDAEQFEPLLQSDQVQASYLKAPGGYSALMRCCLPGSWRLGYRRSWNAQWLTSSRRTQHTSISRRRFSQTLPGKREPISRLRRLAAEGISITLRAGTDATRGAFTSPRPIHYRYDRCITVREMARLHGFPDWFRLHETKWHGGRQVGNSVPPPLAYAIAREIHQMLPYAPSCPVEAVTLGDVMLLQMDMSAASKYWGVKNPIRPRDRKSGCRKRSQAQIEAQIEAQLGSATQTHAQTSPQTYVLSSTP